MVVAENLSSASGCHAKRYVGRAMTPAGETSNLLHKNYRCGGASQRHGHLRSECCSSIKRNGELRTMGRAMRCTAAAGTPLAQGGGCLVRAETVSQRKQSVCVCHTKMVPRGLEPRTLRLLAVRSDQLSYETSGEGSLSRCSPRARAAQGKCSSRG